MALCFLPAQHITPIFRRLEQEATHSSPTVHCLHLDRECYMATNMLECIFLSIRMNNEMEGWHTHLNAKGRGGMNFYMVVLLHDESFLDSHPDVAGVRRQVEETPKEDVRPSSEENLRFMEKNENNYRSAHQLF